MADDGLGVANRSYADDEARDEAGPLPMPNIMAPRRKKSSFLGVEGYSELNAHTYVYDANKSFEGMTVSGLLAFYSNLIFFKKLADLISCRLTNCHLRGTTRISMTSLANLYVQQWNN